MQRVTVAARGFDPGTGKLIWQDRNTPAGIAGTIGLSVWLNSVQEELAFLLEGQGYVLDPANNNQILPALESLVSVYISQIPHGHAEFTTVGVTSFVVPAGVFAFHGEMVGGAAGGGGSSVGLGAAGGGGAPGAIRFTQICTPGESFYVSIPAGGAGGAAAGANTGGAGANCGFGSRVAAGGAGGIGSVANGTSMGGAGGSTNVGLMGDTFYNGGNGLGGAEIAIGSNYLFTAGAGASPSLSFGYGAPGGYAQGASGFPPGGGGAGGANGGSGGPGANGAVRLWW